MNNTSVPQDLSQRTVKLARHLQALPDGKYVISLVKSGRNERYTVSIVRQEAIIDKRIFTD